MSCGFPIGLLYVYLVVFTCASAGRTFCFICLNKTGLSLIYQKVHFLFIFLDDRGPSTSYFGREERVKVLLDDSLFGVPMEPQGCFMRITRYPNNNWQLNCAAQTTNFTCTVQVAELRVRIYAGIQVSCFP